MLAAYACGSWIAVTTSELKLAIGLQYRSISIRYLSDGIFVRGTIISVTNKFDGEQIDACNKTNEATMTISKKIKTKIRPKCIKTGLPTFAVSQTNTSNDCEYVTALNLQCMKLHEYN